MRRVAQTPRHDALDTLQEALLVSYLRSSGLSIDTFECVLLARARTRPGLQEGLRESEAIWLSHLRIRERAESQ